MITVSNLVYEYPTKRVLHDICFSIEAHSITALVGPNGAGKTTLLRCLAALDNPYSGQVTIAGLDTVQSPRECHRQLGYLSDFFGLYEDLSVRRSLSYLAMAHHLPPAGIPARVEEVARSLGLHDRLDMRTSDLSRGLRQRVAIGQAIIHRPQVLLLDEPAAGLDPEARHDLSSLLLQLRSEGMTMVVSSHILAELEEYSTHMLVLRDGQIRSHQALTGQRSSASGAEQEIALRIRLALPVGGLDGWLQARDGIHDIQLDEQGAICVLPADPARRTQLLRDLLEAGFPVLEFAEHKRNLQDLYLADARGAQAS